jgi:nucleotide-binding universal stress UspA family protein
MDKIVVGFDGTASARKAADEAAAFALAMGADLHVVTVVTDDPGKHGIDIEVMEGEPVKAVEARSVGLRTRAAEIASQLDGAYEGLTVIPTVLVGPAARSIVDYAKKVDADVIVVGNRRVQGLSRVLGSIAVDILRDAPCPVYIAKTMT